MTPAAGGRRFQNPARIIQANLHGSVQMAHNRWFNLKPEVTEADYAVRGDNPRAIAQELMSGRGLRGELAQVRGASFRIVRPGTVYEVQYAGGTAKVKTNVAGFMGMLNRIHHVGGLWHEYTPTNVWAFFVGAVSAGLLILGGTGIYLWFKIHQERLMGTVLLVVGLAYGLTLVVMIRTA